MLPPKPRCYIYRCCSFITPAIVCLCVYSSACLSVQFSRFPLRVNQCCLYIQQYLGYQRKVAHEGKGLRLFIIICFLFLHTYPGPVFDQEGQGRQHHAEGHDGAHDEDDVRGEKQNAVRARGRCLPVCHRCGISLCFFVFFVLLFLWSLVLLLRQRLAHHH